MSDRLTTLAISYLDHIRIAVAADDRGAPFRDFFDNWNAFRLQTDHHRSPGERPRWFNNPSALARADMLRSLDFISVDAARVIAMAHLDPSGFAERWKAKDTAVRLMVDHAVPIRVMVAMLFDLGPGAALSRPRIEHFLTQWYRLGVISHAEDRLLHASKAGSRMPPDWDGSDCFARYSAAGIKAGGEPKP